MEPIMKTGLLTTFIIVTASILLAQAPDSLLIADFEDPADERGEWTASIGDGFIESSWAEDPTGLSVGALEVMINSEEGIKGGFAHPNLTITAGSDTASALVIYVYMFDDYPATGGGVQIFAQPRKDWRWKSYWTNSSELTLDAWNRLVFDFDETMATDPEYDISEGLQAGVEFVLAEGTEWSDVVYADNIYLLGLPAETGVNTKTCQQPEKFSLEQNYPNPFNPVTKIFYTLPNDQYVTLAVYDAKGRLKQTLVQNEPQPAGRHVFRFDASTLSSGIYFYKLTSGQFSLTKKMSVVK
jgi:hypothetical protein